MIKVVEEAYTSVSQLVVEVEVEKFENYLVSSLKSLIFRDIYRKLVI